jgi:hypothetical protein
MTYGRDEWNQEQTAMWRQHSMAYERFVTSTLHHSGRATRSAHVACPLRRKRDHNFNRQKRCMFYF